MNLNIGDKVLYRKNGMLYEGIIKSIQGDRIEIDDNTIQQVVAAISDTKIAKSIISNPKNKDDSELTKIKKKLGMNEEQSKMYWDLLHAH